MILAAGLFTESMAFDVTVLGGLVGIFATLVAMFYSIKQGQRDAKASRAQEMEDAVSKIMRSSTESRAKEIEDVVSKVISSSTSAEKIVVSPQPFIVEMKQEFVTKNDLNFELNELKRRVDKLEEARTDDRVALMNMIKAVPGEVIALLSDIWRMKQS